MKAFKYLSIVTIALFVSLNALAQSEQQLTVPLSDPGKPYKLTVEIISGSIKVVGYDGKDIVIDVQGDTGKREERDHEASNGMRRISGTGSLYITAREKNNAVTVDTDLPARHLAMVIKVPVNANTIKLSTINSGNITVSGVNGALELGNINGNIKATDVSGSVVANTTNGAVVVVLKTVEPKAPMAFTTLNGNIDVTFPANLKANMKLRSDRGNVYTDFDLTPDKSQPKTTKVAKDGMYSLSVEDWITGKVDGGGPEMLMKNMNGNIYVRKAK